MLTKRRNLNKAILNSKELKMPKAKELKVEI